MLVERMLEYVTWEQAIIVLMTALWLVKVAQVILLRMRMHCRTTRLEGSLAVVNLENSAMKAKLHSSLCPEDYEAFMGECVE
jgi:hypothetical protein